MGMIKSHKKSLNSPMVPKNLSKKMLLIPKIPPNTNYVKIWLT